MARAIFYIIDSIGGDFRAQDANAVTLPWEIPFGNFQEFMTGTFARAVSLVAIIAAGAGLMLGGHEISSFVRSMLFILLVLGIILVAGSIITKFGATTTT